ncbi:MAG: hypothetical protein EBQ80_05225 [Proteobacteria bacterium]|nr:hypothetical protein [Pseudomonadota bacterium]
MELLVKPTGIGAQATATIGNLKLPALIGKNGTTRPDDMREGMGKTPLGTWQILYGFYRPDKIKRPPQSAFHWLALSPEMGWCDAPADPLYNQFCPAGYPASHEKLWRDDDAYNYVLVMNHNTPAKAGFGSAIFTHVWKKDATFTLGCIALEQKHLEQAILLGMSQVTVS